MIGKYSGNTTLKEAVDEMEENNMSEITRIMKINGVWYFEYK